MSDTTLIQEPRTQHGILIYDGPGPIRQLIQYMPKDGEVYIIKDGNGWKVDVARDRAVAFCTLFDDALFIAKRLKEKGEDGKEPESPSGDVPDDSYTDAGAEPEEDHTRESGGSPEEPEGDGEDSSLNPLAEGGEED
jgi:hypothetical protein